MCWLTIALPLGGRHYQEEILGFKGAFLTHIGLAKPINFSRLLKVICITVALITCLMIFWHWSAGDFMPLGSPRFYFMLYLITLLCFAFLLLGKARLSYSLVCLASVEIFLLLFSAASERLNLGFPYLIPSHQNNERIQFQFHPQLAAVPVPNFKSTHGVKTYHNKFGLRGYEIGDVKTKKLIHAYGGSSTYDVGVSQGSTWPEILDAELGPNSLVANFGVPGFGTSEHLIQTAFYSDLLGRYPDCAVYYIGWNDIHNSHIPTLEKGYSDYHVLTLYDNLQIRRTSFYGSFSPLHMLLGYGFYYHDWVVRAKDYRSFPPSNSLIDQRLKSIYLDTVISIAALNSANGVESIFIGQLLNPEQLKANTSYGWAPFISDNDLWEVQKKFNSFLHEELTSRSITMIIPNIDDFDDTDFVDYGHFSAAGSKKFSKFIAPTIARKCK